MVNTRTDADLSAAIQNTLQTLLLQIHAEICEEFRTVRCWWKSPTGYYSYRFLRLAGFFRAAADTEKEQAKNFQWGLR
nr:hypothetical protein [Tanacetum cinerariifolium]